MQSVFSKIRGLACILILLLIFAGQKMNGTSPLLPAMWLIAFAANAGIGVLRYRETKKLLYLAYCIPLLCAVGAMLFFR